MAEFLRDRLQDFHSRTGNLGADAIAGQEQDFKMSFKTYYWPSMSISRRSAMFG